MEQGYYETVGDVQEWRWGQEPKATEPKKAAPEKATTKTARVLTKKKRK
jgi:hypothetical protein